MACKAVLDVSPRRLKLKWFRTGAITTDDRVNIKFATIRYKALFIGKRRYVFAIKVATSVESSHP